MSEASRFDRIEELFHAAQALEPAQRVAFLALACGADAALREEIESLLAADSGGTAGVRQGLASSVSERGPLLAAGDSVGPYRIVELIGEGGMGEVYRAEQSEPLARQVALKVIKAGMDTRQVLRRFEIERQTLARMSHPGVARVFDAGATPTGRPYFAMELVAGEPVTEFCDARRLPLGPRLELFRRTCEAVQHAHQKGVIHRDLKPANILVEEHDGRPQPKIIDFGIAKATAPDAADSTAATRIGQLVGTPEYMSPEQSDLGAVLDTRTDVYSLGIVLYELLAGAHPHDVERLRRSTLDEVRRYLHDTDPERPSARAARSGGAAAEARACDPASLRRSLAGDLDWIVAKALEKEPERRYASVSELAADVDRHLRHEPVLAGPPSRAYRARKFVRRHRWAVTAAAALAVILLGAFAGVSAALARALRAEADALRQAKVAEEVTGFLESLFEADDPFRSEPSERTLRDVVSEATERLDGSGVADPEVFGRLAVSLVKVMLSQGLREEGLLLARRAVGRLRGTPAAKGTSYLELLYLQGRAETLSGRYEDARRTTTELVALAAVVAPQSPRLGVYLKARGDAEGNVGGTSEARELWHRKALAALRAAPDASPVDLGLVLFALAGSTTDPRECTLLANEQLGIWREHLGTAHPRVAEAQASLSGCARMVGDAEEAERQLRQAVELRRRVLGPSHPFTFESVIARLDALYAMGRFDVARELADSSLAEAWKTDQRSAIASLLNAAYSFLPGDANFADARRRLEEAVTIYLELHAGESEWSLMARHTLADSYADEGRLPEAREQYLHVLREREALVLPPNFFLALLLENLATTERRLGLFAEAGERISEGLKRYPAVAWDPRYHARAWVSKATLLVAEGRAEEADVAFAKAADLYAGCEGPRTFLDLRYEAAWRALRGERAPARELVREMYRMGVHPDFLIHEPELVALFGDTELRRLADEVQLRDRGR